jgi:hypothetical protein
MFMAYSMDMFWSKSTVRVSRPAWNLAERRWLSGKSPAREPIFTFASLLLHHFIILSNYDLARASSSFCVGSP